MQTSQPAKLRWQDLAARDASNLQVISSYSTSEEIAEEGSAEGKQGRCFREVDRTGAIPNESKIEERAFYNESGRPT